VQKDVRIIVQQEMGKERIEISVDEVGSRKGKAAGRGT